MKTHYLKASVLVLALFSALLSNSCGVSGIGGGIGGSGIISVGAITALGSVVVNGAEFDTSNAEIIVEGEIIGIGDDIVLDNLDIGMVVTVEGTGNEDDENLVADRVIYNDNVEGPVQSITDVSETRKDIVVLGQTVVLNTVTVFKETTFEDIAENDVVEVSGLSDYTGDIWATFLEKTEVDRFEVTGFVESLDDPVQETFKINALTVDYSSADTSGLPGGVPANGLLVEVEGTLNGLVMEADAIELGDELEEEDADEIEVTGFVTDVASAFEFTVGNQVVRTDADTEFVDGTADDIVLGQKLEAEGTLEDGILFAEEIEFWEPDQIEVEGLVTDDTLAPAEFTVGDQVVQTDAGTVYEGGEPEDIVLGVNIEIKGVPVDIIRSILIADKVSFEDEELE